MGVSGMCMVALTAALAVVATGCSGKCTGASNCKMVAGCKKKCAGKCAGKCKTPCRNPDGTVKCASDCKKPCCAKKGADAKGAADAGGAQGAKDAKVVAAVNKNCPISGNPVRAGVTTVTDGKTVGFCCGGCIGRWEAFTQAERKEKLAGAM